jgi:hypothetical protein
VIGEAAVEESNGCRANGGSIEHPNPMNKWYFLSYIIGCTLAFLFGSLSFFDKPYKALFGVLLFWSIGLFFLTGILWKEIIHRPLSVTISDDGLLLHLRFGRLVRIEWSDILWVSASPGGAKDAEGVPGRGAGIKAKGSIFYDLAYEVGCEIRNKYIQMNGRRPLTRLQYNEARKR